MPQGAEMLQSNPEMVSKKDYVQVSPDSARCVDDRKDKSGENLGHQFPGASEHIMDLILIAATKSGVSLSEDELFEMTQQVYQSDAAKNAKLVPGMHIDDEHGHLSDSDCEGRINGCGYDGVRDQVLDRFGVSVNYDPGTRIAKARKIGWGVQVLTGNHEAGSAAINFVEGTTLKTQELWKENRVPSFNHDIWAVKVFLPEMVKALKTSGNEEAAVLINQNAMSWSEEIYGHTLDILTKGVLNSSNLKRIE